MCFRVASFTIRYCLQPPLTICIRPSIATQEQPMLVAAPSKGFIKDRGDDETTEEGDVVVLDSDPEANCFNVPVYVVAAQLFCLPIFLCDCCGIFVLREKQETAVLYFGKYFGSVSFPGVHFLPPVGRELRTISTATRTVDMKNLKVVDSRGNPVVVGAVVTFDATSAKKARIDVQNPWPNASWQPAVSSGTYLQLQAQAVLKQVTSQFPYEAPNGEPSLQTEGAHITKVLVKTLQQRVKNTGAKILSFDLIDLSYAPEIAQSMLLRQQASALVDARKLIVEAAVDMTYGALESLQAKLGSGQESQLSKVAVERISTNLLTVVCSNEAVTPTVSLNGEGEQRGASDEILQDLSRSVQSLSAAVRMQYGGGN